MSNRHSSIVNRQSDDELISAWLDGRLSNAERVAFEARLRAEPDLKRKADATRLLVATARALPAQPLPRDFTIPVPIAGAARTHPRPPVHLFTWFLRVGSALAAAVFVIAIGLDLAGLSAPRAQPPMSATQAAFAAPPMQSEDSIAADAARIAPAPPGAAAPPGATPEAQPASGEPPMQAMRQGAESAVEAQPASEQAQPMVAPKDAPDAAPAAMPEAGPMQRDAATEQIPSATRATQAEASTAPQSTETPQPPDAMMRAGERAGAPAAQPDTTPWWRIVAGVALALAVSLGVLGWRRS